MKVLMPMSLVVLVALLIGAVPGPGFSQGSTKANGGFGGPDLVEGLRSSKGCLGVETAQTPTGKNAIFAWFENKAAVVDWYYSETHQGAMAAFVKGGFESSEEPLAHVADDCGPILCIASITPVAEGKVKNLSLPVSQIAIELYQPLPGGIAVGGRFAPSKVAVPHLREVPLSPPGR